MAFANIWLGLRDDANTLVKAYITHDEETGPYAGPIGAREGRIFRFMADQQNVAHLFKPIDIGGNDWHLWTISFEDDQFSLAQIKLEIDWLLTQYPAQVVVTGAWKWTGEQYGTEHVYDTRLVDKWVTQNNPNYDPNEFLPDDVTPNPSYDPDRYIRVFLTDVEEEYISGMTGTPIYPLHPRLLDFMPNVGDPPVTATELADVNLLAGQASRSFF